MFFGCNIIEVGDIEMGFVELLLLSVGLGMDAFAVSVCMHVHFVCDKLLLSIWTPPCCNDLVGEPYIHYNMEVFYLKLKLFGNTPA